MSFVDELHDRQEAASKALYEGRLERIQEAARQTLTRVCWPRIGDHASEAVSHFKNLGFEAHLRHEVGETDLIVSGWEIANVSGVCGRVRKLYVDAIRDEKVRASGYVEVIKEQCLEAASQGSNHLAITIPTETDAYSKVTVLPFGVELVRLLSEIEGLSVTTQSDRLYIGW